MMSLYAHVRMVIFLSLILVILSFLVDCPSIEKYIYQREIVMCFWEGMQYANTALRNEVSHIIIVIKFDNRQ